MLEHLIRPAEPGTGGGTGGGTGPGTEGVPTVILLHGRGSDMHDLFSLAPALPREWSVVSVQAPHPGMAWGYGPGWAWYRYLAEDRVVNETLEASLEALDRFLEALPELLGHAPGPIVMGGFSQGGTTSLAYALSRPGAVQMVMNFSGFLVDAPLARPTAEAVANLPIFWGHGTRDPAIPFTLALRGREALAGVGADVVTADHPGGHFIAPEELRAAVAWAAQRAVGTTPP